MGTSLQEQLKRIASAAGISSSKHIRGKPSLLFSFKEAADKGVDDIYDVAVQGELGLCPFIYTTCFS